MFCSVCPWYHDFKPLIPGLLQSIGKWSYHPQSGKNGWFHVKLTEQLTSFHSTSVQNPCWLVSWGITQNMGQFSQSMGTPIRNLSNFCGPWIFRHEHHCNIIVAGVLTSFEHHEHHGGQVFPLFPVAGRFRRPPRPSTRAETFRPPRRVWMPRRRRRSWPWRPWWKWWKWSMERKQNHWIHWRLGWVLSG